jgi:hypothetical protein
VVKINGGQVTHHSNDGEVDSDDADFDDGDDADFDGEKSLRWW